MVCGLLLFFVGGFSFSVMCAVDLSRSFSLVFTLMSLGFLPLFLAFEPPHRPSLITHTHTLTYKKKTKQPRQSIESDRKMGQKSIYDSAPLTHRATGHYLLFLLFVLFCFRMLFFLFFFPLLISSFSCSTPAYARTHPQQSRLRR